MEQKRRRMTGAQRKDRILEAAQEVAAQHGAQGATTSRIAAAAGVSEKILYAHFSSKKEILLAVLDRVLSQARTHLNGREEEKPLQRLHSAVELHWSSGPTFVYPLFEFFVAPPELGLREELRVRQQAGIERLAQIVEDGKAEGAIRADVDAEQTAWEIFSICWAEDVAYMLRFEEFASGGRSAIMLERILRDISAASASC